MRNLIVIDLTKQRELSEKVRLELDILEAWLAENVWLGECRMVKVKNGGRENYHCLFSRNMQRAKTIHKEVKAIQVLFKNMRVSDKKWEVKRRLDIIRDLRSEWLKEIKRNLELEMANEEIERQNKLGISEPIVFRLQGEV